MTRNAKLVAAAGQAAPFVLPPLEIIKKRLLRQLWLIVFALLWALAILIDG